MSYEISNEQKALLLDKKAEYEKIKQEKEKLEAEVETLLGNVELTERMNWGELIWLTEQSCLDIHILMERLK